MAIMAIAVAVAFSAPSFADEKKGEKKDKDKGKLVQMLNADEKKDEKKGEKKDKDKGK
jgi:hypothetical protein